MTRVPYFRAIVKPGSRVAWSQCPDCGVVVKTANYGAAKHWAAAHGAK